MLAGKGIGKIAIIVAVVVALAGLAFLYTDLTGMYVFADKNYDNFAKCLTEKGIVMYGTSTCPHCQNQKKMFGDSFKYVNYVDCINNTTLCQDNGIQFVPTWYIGGNLYTGEKTIEQLKSLSGCEVS